MLDLTVGNMILVRVIKKKIWGSKKHNNYIVLNIQVNLSNLMMSEFEIFFAFFQNKVCSLKNYI
jgi:hypothetical protein